MRTQASEQWRTYNAAHGRIFKGWKVISANGGIVASIAEAQSPEIEHERANLIAAAPELLSAAIKALAFIDDLSKSNPGFMRKLVLQDYAQWNEAMIELPRAIAKAGGAQ